MTKRNECVPNNSWIVIIDPQGESEVHYREVVSSADCASLTSSWTVEEVSASNCTH